ncbi:MAG: oligosaccharide flippase family protein [Pasteurella oralis]|uniref:oligosaccharide flippase family protein n=1 Tax=Pasteurella oralis TaxID=1071947 RepID=UPI0026FB8E7B|nr:oligosaccharide flippase family protein [Pasteurella oralis]
MKAVKDSVIYLAGELLSRSVPFLLLPYLSRRLGVDGFGELSYYQTFTVLFFIVVGLSQDGAVTRYFYAYGKRSLNLVVNAGYAYTLATGSLILLGCWIVQSPILAYVALSAIFQSLLGVQLCIRQCQRQPLAYIIIQFLSSISAVAFTLLLLECFETQLVEKRLLAILLGNILAFGVAYGLYIKNHKWKKHSSAHYLLALNYLFAFGVPLILHNVSLFLKGQLDRIFIFHQFSQVELGLYAMGAQIAAILMIILQAMNKAGVPYFFEALKQKRISLNQVHKWALLSLLIVPIPALIALIIPESLVVWLLGEQFIGTKYYIVCFLFSTALVIPYFLLVNYLSFYGKNKLISLCSVISTLAYVVSLLALTFTQIEFIPFASIIGSLVILPVLFMMTKKVGNTL